MQFLYIYAGFEDVYGFCLLFFISSVTLKQKPKKPRICFLSLRLRLASSQHLYESKLSTGPS